MAFWLWLYKNPKRAYGLGGFALLAGVALGCLGLWEKNDVQAKFFCVLSASFLFSLWSLLTAFGGLASYGGAMTAAFRERAGRGDGPADAARRLDAPRSTAGP